MVVHGGPGAAGELAHLAAELSARGHATLEPWQTATSVSGQIGELAQAIAADCAPPVVLIGWSWGAWLAALTAQARSDLVAHLVLVGSGPLGATAADSTQITRRARLGEKAWREMRAAFADPGGLHRGMDLLSQADDYDPLDTPLPAISHDPDIHRQVWAEARALRASGALLERVGQITCPITVIHGSYDPHPAAGVIVPLKARLPAAEIVLLRHCGHTPWRERRAQAPFFATLERVIAGALGGQTPSA